MTELRIAFARIPTRPLTERERHDRTCSEVRRLILAANAPMGEDPTSQSSAMRQIYDLATVELEREVERPSIESWLESCDQMLALAGAPERPDLPLGQRVHVALAWLIRERQRL